MQLRTLPFRSLLLGFAALAFAFAPHPVRAETRYGYTAHFTHIHSVEDADRLVREAHAAGARCLNVVPTARIWRNRKWVRMLDRIFADCERDGMQIVITRTDGSDDDGTNELFKHVLTRRGRLPDGATTTEWFEETVGLKIYERWMAEETRYYARRYGRRKALAGYAPGGFVESFVSQRGAISDYSKRTNVYEYAQYTPSMRAEWHAWLRKQFGTLDRVNAEYGTRFRRYDAVPMPHSERDPSFRNAWRAYADFGRAINDWWLEQYRQLHAVWHAGSSTPMIWLFSAGDAEKMYNGRAGMTVLDLPKWLRTADAVGLSLYTYPGFPEHDHPSMAATVRLLAGAVEAGKQLFVLECGTESPDIVYDPFQFEYVTHLPMPLRPQTLIYEYFKYHVPGAPLTSGFMLDSAFRKHEPGYTGVRRILANAAGLETSREVPWLYWLQMPDVARDDPDTAALNRLAYEAATWLPMRILDADASSLHEIPAGAWVLLPPDRRHLKSSAYYSEFERLASLRGWRVIRDAKANKPAAGRLDLVQLAREERSEASDLLFEHLREWRGGEAVPRPAVLPARGVVSIPLKSGALIFIEKKTPTEVDLRGLGERQTYRIEIRDADGTARRIRLIPPRGSTLKVEEAGRTLSLESTGSPEEGRLEFDASPTRAYVVRR